VTEAQQAQKAAAGSAAVIGSCCLIIGPPRATGLQTAASLFAPEKQVKAPNKERLMHSMRGKHQQRAARNLVFVLAGCKQVIPEGEKESKICPEQSSAAAAAAATTPISSYCKVAHGVGTHNRWPTAVTTEQIQMVPMPSALPCTVADPASKFCQLVRT